MTTKRTYLALIIVTAFAGFVLTPTFAQAPAEPQTVSTIANTTTTTTAATTTTTTLPTLMTNCPMWQQAALDAGFELALLPRLDHVLYRESRCDPSQLNATDPNGGSVGLAQINRFWCLPSRYYSSGYLQHVGVLVECDELYVPAVNLRAAAAIVAYSREVGLCAWSQWAWVATPCESDE